jgi:hypothetical protein
MGRVMTQSQQVVSEAAEIREKFKDILEEKAKRYHALFASVRTAVETLAVTVRS